MIELLENIYILFSYFIFILIFLLLANNFAIVQLDRFFPAVNYLPMCMYREIRYTRRNQLMCKGLKVANLTWIVREK